MRAKEFLAERQKLDELFFIPPAITAIGAAIGRTVAWRALMVAFNTWSIVEMVTGMVGVIERTGLDVDKMDVGDWITVAITVVFGPWAIKAGLRTPKDLIDLMPASAKQTFGNWVKTTFEGKVKEEIAKKAATATPKPVSTGPKDPNKIDRPFSKDAPAAPAPTPGASAFDKMATDLTKAKPKNPNLVDRPFSK
jgi:hypothetical protein